MPAVTCNRTVGRLPALPSVSPRKTFRTIIDSDQVSPPSPLLSPSPYVGSILPFDFAAQRIRNRAAKTHTTTDFQQARDGIPRREGKVSYCALPGLGMLSLLLLSMLFAAPPVCKSKSLSLLLLSEEVSTRAWLAGRRVEVGKASWMDLARKTD